MFCNYYCKAPLVFYQEIFLLYANSYTFFTVS